MPTPNTLIAMTPSLASGGLHETHGRKRTNDNALDSTHSIPSVRRSGRDAARVLSAPNARQRRDSGASQGRLDQSTRLEAAPRLHENHDGRALPTGHGRRL